MAPFRRLRALLNPAIDLHPAPRMRVAVQVFLQLEHIRILLADPYRGGGVGFVFFAAALLFTLPLRPFATLHTLCVDTVVRCRLERECKFYFTSMKLSVTDQHVFNFHRHGAGTRHHDLFLHTAQGNGPVELTGK